MASFVTIDGTDLPEPSFPDGYNVSIQDIVKEAFRDASSGKLKADKVAQKVKIELTYKVLTNAEFVTLFSLVKPATFFFNVTYIDPRTGTTNTGVFYSGDISKGTFKYDSSANTITHWRDVKVNLIEQ